MDANERLSGSAAMAMPLAQYLDIRHKFKTMAMCSGQRLLDAPLPHVGVMAAYVGALIVAGALFSVLLSAGVEAQGPRRLLEGLGFNRRVFFVI